MFFFFAASLFALQLNSLERDYVHEAMGGVSSCHLSLGKEQSVSLTALGWTEIPFSITKGAPTNTKTQFVHDNVNGIIYTAEEDGQSICTLLSEIESQTDIITLSAMLQGIYEKEPIPIGTTGLSGVFLVDLLTGRKTAYVPIIDGENLKIKITMFDGKKK